MHLTNEWFYFLSALPPEKCDEIIELGHQKKFIEGTADTSEEEATDEERRIGRTRRHGLLSLTVRSGWPGKLSFTSLLGNPALHTAQRHAAFSSDIMVSMFLQLVSK